jgi:hypothetical protein
MWPLDIDHLRVLTLLAVFGGCIGLYVQIADPRPMHPVAHALAFVGSFFLGALIALVLTIGVLCVAVMFAFALGFI